ncbi:MAG: ABC transporter ATP-binding protein [Proteobacteria bacterium]|nr:ABC transporter ATP-binding protein [Pseudomonadota bacterium]
MLKLSGLGKSYPHPSGAVTVLTGIDALIEDGERVAIIGPSGSGKSTLLALLSGLDQPTSGTIELAGKVLGSLSERELTAYRARYLGIVFQQFHLMGHLSALENVTLPLRIAGHVEVEARAVKALQDVGLGHRLNHLPQQLSGGECQRVAIARAIVGEPPLILADEPSGNLDAKTGDQVMQLLFDLVRQRRSTLVLVTHNEHLASWCDRRLLLSGGHLVDV